MDGLNTDKEKVEAAYKYIVENIKYDNNKINTISTDYVPDLNTIITKQEESVMITQRFLGILRSEGIHTKLVKGYKSDITAYHAWNES